MTEKNWKITKLLPSPRLIPGWKNLKLLINNILKDIKSEELRNNVIVLSDWPKTLYKESHHPHKKPFVCFYSININYFVSLDWVEPYEKQMQAVLWTQEKITERKGIIKKMKFHTIAQVPPIKAMVHTGSYHMLIVYCGDNCLRLFGDHSQAFTSLGTVPCRFCISCLCYDSETEMLLSGALGAVITWLILPGGKGLQVSQTVSMPGDELVHSLSLSGPQGSLLALCENMVRVLTHQGQGQLKAVRTFTLTSSGSCITCSYSCVFQSTFYAGNRAGEIHAWGLDKGNFLHSFQAHSSSVLCVYSRPETHTLFTAGTEGVLREWNLASGNLLRQLSIDDNLQHLQFIDNTTFYCQSAASFSLYHLPYFYSLFNVCGSAPQKLQRVCCGHKWTRILCATEDGLLRFLSPVTGDLLVITWPLIVMDNTMAWAYDPDREELFVAIGSPEVLVFDASRSPCPAKYIVCTSENQMDKVQCLAYGRYNLIKNLKGLMFCGHESGIVRVLSQYHFACTEKTVHSGAVLALSTLEGLKENSFLCSYGKDNIVHLTEVVLFKNDIMLQPASKILCVSPLKHVVLLPGAVGAITEDSCWCICHYQDSLTSSEPKQMLKETNCLHECAVTSFDVCLLLKLFVTGAVDGSVRIWDFRGRLMTELDSALHFGPLCFANNRGDLLLTFNQSIYIVSCLKLLSLTQLKKLDSLSNDDEIHESPKPFLPSFFFLFEMVFVPKFVFLGQKLQKLQGLETLVNKRVIAFDNSVPHVVEEERCISSMTQERPWLNFLEDNYVDLSTHDHEHPCSIPAQLQLPGWNGLNTYRKLQSFFGQGKQWPFAPDCYIPNSVVRACLWPEGTPIFLRYDFCLPHQEKYLDMTRLLRYRPQSSVSLEDEDASSIRWEDIYQEQKRTSYGVLENLTQKNWVGRKVSEGFIENIITTVLHLTVYCSAEKYRIYFNGLAQIFATYQISPQLQTETACRLLNDTAHFNSLIRELAWEMLEKLGFISHLFAIPLAVGLMDSEKNVRSKVLYLMTRFTGIQSKSMLMYMLKKPETLQEMQLEMVGEASLAHLLGIDASDMQCLLTHVQQRLNENLTLSHREGPFRFSFETAKDDELGVITEETPIPLSEPESIMEVKKRKRHIQAKRRKLIKKVLEGTRKDKQKKLQRVALPSEDAGEQIESRASGQMDTQYVALEPELLPSPGKLEDESKEVMLEHSQYSEVLEGTDQHSVEGKREEHKKPEKKKDSGDISELTVKEPKEEVEEEITQVSGTESDIRVQRPSKSSHGLTGIPGHVGRSDTRSWRDDICYLVTSRIASSNPGMMRDLGKELIEVAQMVLTDRQPSWHLFQEICPLLKASSTSTSKLDKQVKGPPIAKRAVKGKGMMIPRKQKDKSMGKKDVRFSPKVTKKKMKISDHQDLEKRKLKKTVQILGKQKVEMVKDKRKFINLEEKMQEKRKLTKGKKKPTHPEEAVTQEKEILALPQRTLSTGDQKLVLEESELTRKEERPLGKGKEVIWEEESPTPDKWKPDWENIMEVQEDRIRPRQERLLSGREVEEIVGEKEELDIEERVGKGKEKPQEERLVEEKEEEDRESYLYGEEEESSEEERVQKADGESVTEDGEGYLYGEEKESSEEPRVRKADGESVTGDREDYLYGEEKESAEEQRVQKADGESVTGDGEGYLYGEEKESAEEQRVQKADGESVTEDREGYLYGEEEESSEEEQVQAADEESISEQEDKLAQSSVGEEKGVGKHVREEEEQEKQDHKERQRQEEEEKAIEKKHLVQEREKAGLKENEELKEMRKFSQEVRLAWRRASKAQGEERYAHKEVETSEGERPEVWEKEKMDLNDEALAEKMRKRSQPEEAQEEKKAEEERLYIMGRMQLAEKVDDDFEKIKLQPREKIKVVIEKREIEKMSPPKEKQDMKKEKQVKKERERIVKSKKATEQEEKWTTQIEKAVPQKKKVAQEERLQSEKEVRQLQEVEEEIEEKKAGEGEGEGGGEEEGGGGEEGGA
uniref:WD repeat-containing protein 87-like n=1 Tax=Jaculus jaculus TaxID=51337 RepID=UPI001E1B278C